MAVTSTPIFCQAPNVGEFNVILSQPMAANTAFDGTEPIGNAYKLVFTAGTDGSRVDQVTCRLASINGANATGTSNATVARFWVNNGQVSTSANNNIFLGEVAIPSTTVVARGTAALTAYPLTLPTGGLNIPANTRIYAGLTVGAGIANVGIAVSAFGGNY